MRDELLRLRAGEISFDEFARETRHEWERLGIYLLRRWRSPEGVELADVVQEMLLRAWCVLGEFDPARGVALERFVTYNAVACAKKWLHKQRVAYRRDDRSPSRHPLVFSSLGERAEKRLEPSGLGGAEEEADWKSRLALALGLLDSEVDRMLVLRLVDARGDIDRAAKMLVHTGRSRLLFRIETEAAARGVLRRAAARAAASLEHEEARAP